MDLKPRKPGSLSTEQTLGIGSGKSSGGRWDMALTLTLTDSSTKKEILTYRQVRRDPLSPCLTHTVCTNHIKFPNSHELFLANNNVSKQNQLQHNKLES